VFRGTGFFVKGEIMRLPDNVYNILKWICLLALPATTFITSVSETLGYSGGAQIAAIVSALGVFAGAVIKVSTDAYNASNNND
jgi:hypothetical protein